MIESVTAAHHVPKDLVIADERELLKKYVDVHSLLGEKVNHGQTVLISGHVKRATEISATYRSNAGGAAIPDWWTNDPEVYSSDVHLFRLRNAFYFPEFGTVVSAEGQVMRSTFSEASYILSTPEKLPVSKGEIETIDRAIISFPWGANANYGHFVVDCLPAVAVTRQIGELTGYEYIFPVLKSWHRRHLHLAGLNDFRELTRKVYYIKDAIFTSCMDHFMHAPNDNLKLLRDIELLNARKSAASTSASASRIYMTRKGDQKRIFEGEQLLEDQLRSMEFQVVDPAQHSVDEQIAMFRAADTVVGCTGAAFTNVLYCNPSARIIEIQPTHLQGIWVRNLCAITGSQWSPFFCHSSPPESPPLVGGKERPEIGMSFRLDIDDFVSFVKGML
jgi:capsular polysaccharide biosynthesis protein